ncbi:MAG: hypothetical protein RIR17_1218 [Planctomycetota bacterium]|jgi:Holliday junction DNA helicase RuvA
MITKITGLLNTVSEDDARIQVGALEYQVLVTELVRRQIQGNVGQEISLHTMHFLEGNPVQQGRMIPRLLGFLHENDMAFFELFCTVDGIGVKKAIRVIAMPVQQIADAIQRSDVKWLTTLPGIGAAMAEKIVAGLRKKVAPFALAVSEIGDGKTGKPAVQDRIFADVFNALMALGLGPSEARNRVDQLIASGKVPASVEEAITTVFKG